MTEMTDLNERQREAVLHEGGPLLVLAGAGSGKTRVITHRVAHLIRERGVAPRGVLAVTFTNKAAEEMRSRVLQLVGEQQENPVVGTFHRFCVRVLRRFAPAIGFPSSFSIYDVGDQVALLRKVCGDLGVDGMKVPALQAAISRAKNSRGGPAEALGDGDPRLQEIHDAYQDGLRAAGAMDFDDLLLRTAELLEARDDLLRHHRTRFEHLLVDEYQDTNHPQYRLVRLLAPPQNNVCAVGDDDQSIYRWRGADVENILRFERDFPGTKVVKLEQNYRSTQTILDAAHGVVERLAGRRPKKLWTDRAAGEPVTLYRADSEEAEASFVVSQIEALLPRRPASDFAVLFRTNAQSRPFEEALSRHRIPYQLVGGTRFYDRKEIKDVIAYLRLAANSADLVSLRRVVSSPPRGIGEATMAKLERLAEQRGVGAWEAISNHLRFLDAGPKAKRALTLFKEMIEAVGESIQHEEPPSRAIDFVLKESGYLGALVKENSAESMGRIESLRELIAAAKGFEAANPGAGTAAFLDQAALVSESDDYDPAAPRATLLTLHCAKGLEFGVAFLVGIEEGLLPHSRNSGDPEALEEERRLCYVGMTRARDKLFLSAARTRRTYDGFARSKPSRFLDDLPTAVLDERGAEARRKRRRTTVGANIENIGKFFKDKKIDVDLSKLRKQEAGAGGAEFRVGDRVEFAKYGVGKVVGVSGEGDELRYTVSFPGVGPKKLLARIAKLKKA